MRTLLPSGTKLVAVVKSDGYGHGIEVAARTFLAAGADLLAVATLDEALRLRRARIDGSILVLFAVPPAAVVDAADARLALVAADMETLRETAAVWREARRGGKSAAEAVPVHLEIETGLGRAGFTPDRAADAARVILDTPDMALAGIWSHLASSHAPDVSYAQLQRFTAATAALEAAGMPLPPRHVAATGALFAGTAPPFEIVRPGLALYGEIPAGLPIVEQSAAAAANIRPAMTLKCRALRVEEVTADTPVGYGGTWRAGRRSMIATLPLGYGDGWVRAYGGITHALVRGRRVPLVGTVAMDAVAADVTAVDGVTLADEFVLLGAQDGERITASELARTRNTISWEVLSGLSARVPRVYHAAAGLAGLRTLIGETLAEVER